MLIRESLAVLYSFCLAVMLDQLRSVESTLLDLLESRFEPVDLTPVLLSGHASERAEHKATLSGASSLSSISHMANA